MPLGVFGKSGGGTSLTAKIMKLFYKYEVLKLIGHKVEMLRKGMINIYGKERGVPEFESPGLTEGCLTAGLNWQVDIPQGVPDCERMQAGLRTPSFYPVHEFHAQPLVFNTDSQNFLLNPLK